MSLKSFSQNDTDQNKFVHLTINQAKGAIKDAIKLDGCIEENQLLNNQILLWKEVISNKDSLISGYKEINENQKKIIKNDEIKEEAYKANEVMFQKQIKKEKGKKLPWILGTIVGIVGTIAAATN